MKIVIIQDGAGGEIAREVVELPDDSDTYDIAEEIMNVLEIWILGVGDTIRIQEVQGAPRSRR